MNWKLFLLSVVFTLPTFSSIEAQVRGGDFQKLFDWYAMEDYERCAYKAEVYTRRDKYRRAPEPYMYLALCMYQAHINPDAFDDEFKDPIKDALKYAYKFRKKDKSGELYALNKRQIDQIREEALDRAKFYFNDGDFYKASFEFKRILKVMPDDVNVAFITGVAMVSSRNVTEGERLIEQTLDTLRMQDTTNTFEKDDVTHDMLIKAFISYTNFLLENERLDEALDIITLGRRLVPDDSSLKGQYKKLYARAPDEEEEAEEAEEEEPRRRFGP
ncbi:MAG: hypothetical protein WEC59_09730 [Salibacteraceae bacterium]